MVYLTKDISELCTFR